jgi:hypothetical protein
MNQPSEKPEPPDYVADRDALDLSRSREVEHEVLGALDERSRG